MPETEETEKQMTYMSRILTIKQLSLTIIDDSGHKFLKYVFFSGDTISPADTGEVWLNPDSPTVTYTVEEHKPL